MDEYESLSHTTWDCKYHVVFIPKCRRRTLYQELRRHLGEVFRRLALQKESKVEEGHLMPDHVHMLLSIVARQSGWEGSDNQDGHFGGRGEEMIVAARR
jgi:putative transposase